MKPADQIRKYVRAMDYVCAAQIFLRDNLLLQEPLKKEHLKPRLLGHWGTCPGINFVYANLNYLIKKHNLDMIFVLGPGHGFPALQANLWTEGSLEKFYPNATHNLDGLSYLAKEFSWPYGFPSHSNPGAPGVILEGGELGYSLATSYGAVLDNPDLIATCLIGDGEAETGPLATAWHLNKLVSPKNNGAVLPILHLNGYKISGPTLFGRMSHSELENLFTGYGYEPIFVEDIEGEDVYQRMVEVLERAYQKIIQIQTRARETSDYFVPNWPMIILRTPKGWTGPKEVQGQKIEGNALAHQVPLPDILNDENEIIQLENWMKSYNFNELFTATRGFSQDILKLIPDETHRMGSNKHTFTDQIYQELNLPNPEDFTEEVPNPGFIGSSSMRRVGEYLNRVFAKNKDFRLFSPDETYSNKLDKVFENTKRAFEWPIQSWDLDLAREGKVIEMLSEHTLFGLLQGYILSGRHGLFASYEAFVQIISSMADQYLKFLKVSREYLWRGPYSSLNILLTSSGWRQDHNGFSHQNPGFISDMLDKQDKNIKIYFPIDGTTSLFVIDKCLKSKNGVNLIVAGKTQEPRWLTTSQASILLQQEIITLGFASDENPDLVLVGIGDYTTKEILAAIKLIKSEIPEAKLRVVNILEPNVISSANIYDYFTYEKPVYVNFHGYPRTIKKLLFDLGETKRFEVRGYIENGSTTTPFDMHVRNKTSRWHIVLWAVEKLLLVGKISEANAKEITSKYNKKFVEHKEYIMKNGMDLPEIEEFDYQFN